jgi:hypothetical protein
MKREKEMRRRVKVIRRVFLKIARIFPSAFHSLLFFGRKNSSVISGFLNLHSPDPPSLGLSPTSAWRALPPAREQEGGVGWERGMKEDDHIFNAAPSRIRSTRSSKEIPA